MKKNRVLKNFLEQLKKLPNVSSATGNLDISRQTIYRWRKESPEFALSMDSALSEGEDYINDFVENQLMVKIKDENFNAIKFYLIRRHPKYMDKKSDPIMVNLAKKGERRKDQKLMDEAYEKVKVRKFEYYKENDKISIDEISLKHLFKWGFIGKDIYEELMGEGAPTANELIREDIKKLDPTSEEVEEEYKKLTDEKNGG